MSETGLIKVDTVPVLKGFLESYGMLKDTAESMELTEVNIKDGNNLYKEIVNTAKEIEESRVIMKAPYLAAGKMIDDDHKSLIAKFKLVYSGLEKKIIPVTKEIKRKEQEKTDYARKKAEEERVAKEAELLKIAEEAEAEGDDSTADTAAQMAVVVNEESKVEAEKVVVAKGIVRSSGGTISLKSSWDTKIVNEIIIPREFCSSDNKKINTFKKSNKDDKTNKPFPIPGIEWIEKEGLNNR